MTLDVYITIHYVMYIYICCNTPICNPIYTHLHNTPIYDYIYIYTYVYIHASNCGVNGRASGLPFRPWLRRWLP